MQIAGGRDEDVCLGHHVFHGGDFVAFHGGLQRTDRIDLGDNHAGALATQGLAATLAHIPVPQDHGDFAGHHHIGGAIDAVDQRMATAIEVVELALGDGVVDIDGREGQFALPFQLVESVDAGRCLFADAAYRGLCFLPTIRLFALDALQTAQQLDPVLCRIGSGLRHGARLFVLGAIQDHHGGITTIVYNLVGSCPLPEIQGPLRAPPVLLERFTLPGEHRNALGVLRGAVSTHGGGGGGMVLCAKDVAGGPADGGAQIDECLEQHRRLNGHVQ